MHQTNQTHKAMDRVLIVAVQTPEMADKNMSVLLNEMKDLVKAAGGEVLASVQQNLPHVDGRTLVGSGKLEEIQAQIEVEDIDLVVTYNQLSPRVNQNLSQNLGVNVIDRIQLILDIFALRARSREGKLQVELAQYNYLLPRIIGQGQAMSRLGAGIGTRGPGETKLETDRRHIRQRMLTIKRELAKVESKRQQTRQRRRQGKEFNLGLVGYTNAGKSTLLSQLTETETFIKDQVFATLDPLTRKLSLRGNDRFTITDTVGFIEDLPQELVQSFKSTLEEIRDVDLLLHVVDGSDPARVYHEQTVVDLLRELDMLDIPTLTVYNKKDQMPSDFQATLFPNVILSALDLSDIKALKEEIWRQSMKLAQAFETYIDADQAQQIYALKQEAFVESVDFDSDRNQYKVKGYRMP